MSEMSFNADAETVRILEKIGNQKKDDFINRAIKAYATGGGAFDYAMAGGAGGSLASITGTVGATTAVGSAGAGAADVGVESQISAELERLLGPGGVVTGRLAQDNQQLVEFYNAAGQKIASLELSECQSILKSLRPPISQAEVIEMLTLMSIG